MTPRAMRLPDPCNAAVGDLLPELALPPLDRATLALFAGASGDHNPIHIDIDFARRAGMPDVFAHGMLSMAWLGRLLTRWAPQPAMRELSARFVGIAHLGNALTCRGRVVERRRTARRPAPGRTRDHQPVRRAQDAGRGAGRPAARAPIDCSRELDDRSSRARWRWFRARDAASAARSRSSSRARARGSWSTTSTTAPHRRPPRRSARRAARPSPASAASPRPTSPSASSAPRSAASRDSTSSSTTPATPGTT